MSAARVLYERENYPFPPVPHSLAPQLTLHAAWQFGSRGVTHALDDFRGHLDEFNGGWVDDYVEFGHAGHGVDSYAMYYYLAHGPLAVAVQLRWGGALTARDEALATARAVYGGLPDLLRIAEARPAPSDTRLLVTYSDRSGAGLSWIRRRAGAIVNEPLVGQPGLAVFARAADVLRDPDA